MAGGTVAIVGGGPCGLACARTLRELAYNDVVLLERTGRVGGLAASFVDPVGFTWDRGGHVVFSHYGEFDRLLAEVIGEDVEHHERSSFVQLGGQWIPYPLQNNLHRLPAQMAEDAIVGLIAAQHAQRRVVSESVDFRTWMDSMFGDGIVGLFMRPYNEKVWAHPAEAMSSRWIAERVSTVDWRHAVHSLISRVDDEAWGPNNLFAFPKQGGTGEIYRRAAISVSDQIRLGSGVRSVDLDDRRLVLESGETLAFDHLVWTAALDTLVNCISSPVDVGVRDAARELVHNTVTVVGIGYETPLVDERSWLYFPEPDVPFYRATNFAKYAASNVPGGRTDRYCSWMTEIASSDWRPLKERDLASAVDAARRRHGLVPPDAPIASVHIDRVDYGYPVPTLGRDAALRVIQPWLMERGVLARGRFGAWRYELGNMDHAVKMGVDAARWIADGTPEEAWSL